MGAMASEWTFSGTGGHDVRDYVDYCVTTYWFSVMAEHGDGRRFYCDKEWTPRSRTERARVEAEGKADRYAARLETKGFDPTMAPDWHEGEAAYGSESWQDTPGD